MFYFLVASALMIFMLLGDPSYNPTSLNHYFVLIPLGRCGGEASHCGYPDAFLLSFLLKEAARGFFVKNAPTEAWDASALGEEETF